MGISKLEEELATKLPEWIALEIQQGQQMQYALQKLASLESVFKSFDAFIAWIDEDTSAEWFNGEIVFAQPASTRHQLLLGFLTSIFGIFAEEFDLGVVLNRPYKMKLPGYGLEPDLIFVSKESSARLGETYLDGPADLVVEIVSLDSIGRDRGRKFIAYEAAGIPEYWIIDPARDEAEFYQLGPNGRYRLIQLPDDGRYSSLILPGFWLDVNWLWQIPLPSVLQVLSTLKIL